MAKGKEEKELLCQLHFTKYMHTLHMNSTGTTHLP
jgi:hypothetical protein